jgi:hypothetical protein
MVLGVPFFFSSKGIKLSTLGHLEMRVTFLSWAKVFARVGTVVRPEGRQKAPVGKGFSGLAG